MSSFNKDGYSVASFGGMAADLPRIQGYAEALKRVITPESVVLEIGTGSGVMAMHACQLGARRVYAIEPETAIEAARESAAINGYSDRIVFIQDISTRVTLPEQVDILFSDLRGILPLHNHHFESIIDARTRFLKPGGIQIPQRDTLFVAPVDAPDIYQNTIEPWTKNPFDLNMDAGRRWTVNGYYTARAKPEQIVLTPQVWAELDYRTLTELNYGKTLTWVTDAAQTIHGFQVWFDAVLIEDVGFSTAPDQPQMAYNTAFFGLSEPVELSPGDTLQIRLRADNFSGRYTYSWDTQVIPAGSKIAKIHLQQSTFFDGMNSLQTLHMRSKDYQPLLNNEGKAQAALLGWMAEGLRLEDIAERLMQQFPDEFSNKIEAMTKAGDMSVKYGQHQRNENTGVS
jgi:protein arginine N-methyltransferase 1